MHLQFEANDFLGRHIDLVFIQDWKEDDKFLRGGPIFESLSNVPTVVLRQEWFHYGTAWQLTNWTAYIYVAILGVHMVMALAHCLVILVAARTSEAWDSINDIVALAFNSTPRTDALENCGTGVMLARIVRQKVRVYAVQNDQNIKRKVELAFCDDLDVAATSPTNQDPNFRPIEVGRQYG